VCRGYSCANDPRIWKDFERMELNAEWITANLSEQERPHVTGIFMHEAVPSSTLRTVTS
jgi:hypothetical protein